MGTFLTYSSYEFSNIRSIKQLYEKESILELFEYMGKRFS
ncbi:hypothetical protein CPK_ORF00836 [Chlamydia pneumoniae LPCoLN]|nr:hypothetical protein CPK_ORF00836 [Chlamydia pneumoniae LPCoLN]